jgi:hypothetical protein
MEQKRFVHPSFISRDELQHETLTFSIFSVQVILAICLHMSAFVESNEHKYKNHIFVSLSTFREKGGHLYILSR